MQSDLDFECVVVGGGFYGCCLALLAAKYCKRVAVLEKEGDLLQRASYINQARVHTGYHYPRNLVTAYRSFVNFPRFAADFRKAIIKDFVKIYAIARLNSKVNAHCFHEIFKRMGAEIAPAPRHLSQIFDSGLIEQAFLVTEYAFDASVLKTLLREKLERAGVTLHFHCAVDHVEPTAGDRVRLVLENRTSSITSDRVFNCTYSNINQILHRSGMELLPLKHELTELALIDLPSDHQHLGVTVMDGPFFSTMPFPALKLHSLSHVRFTPHYSWSDKEGLIDGHQMLREKTFSSNFSHMQRDAQRFMPIMARAEHRGSLFEIKTVLLESEQDDSRPILFRKDYGMPNFFLVMGGKIDNIYDVLDVIAETKKSLGFRGDVFSKLFS